jgi:hypothetical protein
MRALPARALRSALMLVALALLVLAYGRVYRAVQDVTCHVPGPVSQCGDAFRETHAIDLWDAIF